MRLSLSALRQASIETGFNPEPLATCRRLCARLLPLEQHEMDFLDSLNSRGDIVAELLTNDETLRNRIRLQPGLLWKAQNVRDHFRSTEV